MDGGDILRSARGCTHHVRPVQHAERRCAAGLQELLRDLRWRLHREEAVVKLVIQRPLKAEQQLDPLKAAKTNLALQRCARRDSVERSRPAHLQGELAEDCEDTLEVDVN